MFTEEAKSRPEKRSNAELVGSVAYLLINHVLVMGLIGRTRLEPSENIISDHILLDAADSGFPWHS